MAELTTTKLNPEQHLLLDQPLLRMPYNLTRQTMKRAQQVIDKAKTQILADLTSAQKTATKSSNSENTLSDLDNMISRMKTLKRKLETLHDEEERFNRASRARIEHLQELYTQHSLVDVKYQEWSRVRLSRLLVDYLLRQGYLESAKVLAERKGIEGLVDIEAFAAAHKIEKALREQHDTTLALAWCGANKQALQKMEGTSGTLEFELRFQQYIELVREAHLIRKIEYAEYDRSHPGRDEPFPSWAEKLVEARNHARKYLNGTGDLEVDRKTAGLMTYKPWHSLEPYKSLYSPDRWTLLSTLFLQTHHTLFSLPPRPLLHIALSAGLSALKTPACHSAFTSSSANASSTTTSVCPICSTELNELAKNVPYALHTKSIVENDPVVLPNGRVYGRERLERFNEKVGTEKGWVRDPMGGVNGEKWRKDEIRKVFVM